MTKQTTIVVTGAFRVKVPITTAADDIQFFFFLIFQRKQVLRFHVNRLLGLDEKVKVYPVITELLIVKSQRSLL